MTQASSCVRSTTTEDCIYFTLKQTGDLMFFLCMGPVIDRKKSAASDNRRKLKVVHDHNSITCTVTVFL